MPKSLTTSEPIVLSPEDFDPPLKRKKPTVPYYWTLEEISKEIGCSIRKIQYDITGRSNINLKPSLLAYKAGPTFLVPNDKALAYIQKHRNRKKS